MNTRLSKVCVAGLMAALCGTACARHSVAAGTVRYSIQEHCSHCDIEEGARALAGRHAIDCGRAAQWDDAARAKVHECVLKADGERRPFLAIVRRQGIDSVIIEGLVRSPDGTRWGLLYDSDGTGSGMKCNATVTRRPCSRWMWHPEDSTQLTCDSSGTRSSLCREKEFSLGPPEEASNLFCHWGESNYRSASFCFRVPPGKGNVPAGTSLACRQPRESEDFECSASEDGDDALGLRNDRKMRPESSGTGH